VKGDQADPLVIHWTNRVSPADLIHVLHVYTVPYERRLLDWGASPATLEAYSARERAQRTQRLSGLLNEIGLPAARARLHLERGEPRATILQIAAQWRADLIILGRRTEAEPFPAGPLGSVARSVAFAAPMDVMIVPPIREWQKTTGSP
jgi:nucleotide-binding universal stress UspA family protein